MQQIYDLVIIGGGPGGIGAAVEAKVLGIKHIMMIEKGDNHSQTIRKFYKDNKRVDKNYKGQEIELRGTIDFRDGTKESTLNYFDSLLDSGEIDSAFNSEVESITKEGMYRDWETDRKSTRLNSSHITRSRMPSSA